MHPLQHKLTSVMKQILGVLESRPNKTPSFDILISQNNTYISAKGLYGKKIAGIIDQNGFWTGYTFSYAFYHMLDGLAKKQKLITLSWKDGRGRTHTDYFQSRGQLLSLGEDGIPKVELKITTPMRFARPKKHYINSPTARRG